MEGEGSGFAGAVVDQARDGDEGGQRSHRQNQPVVGADHGGEEGTGETVVRESVDGEEALEGGVRGAENGLAVGQTGVLDEDGRIAVCAYDLLRDGADGGG